MSIFLKSVDKPELHGKPWIPPSANGLVLDSADQYNCSSWWGRRKLQTSTTNIQPCVKTHWISIITMISPFALSKIKQSLNCVLESPCSLWNLVYGKHYSTTVWNIPQFTYNVAPIEYAILQRAENWLKSNNANVGTTGITFPFPQVTWFCTFFIAVLMRYC